MELFINNKNIYVVDCTSFKDKLLGFMFYKNLIIFGKRFINCNKIHTFFMKQCIDICMTDKDNRIVFLRKEVPKNKIILGKGYYTYELPVGSINGLKVGDILKIKE